MYEGGREGVYVREGVFKLYVCMIEGGAVGLKERGVLQICRGLCDRRTNKAFHLDLALLTLLKWTAKSGFSCLNTENTKHKLLA